MKYLDQDWTDSKIPVDAVRDDILQCYTVYTIPTLADKARELGDSIFSPNFINSSKNKLEELIEEEFEQQLFTTENVAQDITKSLIQGLIVQDVEEMTSSEQAANNYYSGLRKEISLQSILHYQLSDPTLNEARLDLLDKPPGTSSNGFTLNDKGLVCSAADAKDDANSWLRIFIPNKHSPNLIVATHLFYGHLGKALLKMVLSKL